jgi:endonuclease YncB( thermonuclease family)
LNDIEVWAKIVDVYDGDTYFAIFEMPRHSIGMYKIRLRKVNAPELDSKRRNEQINAHHCKHTVTNALINKTVHLYGRMLADVRINGTTDLGEILTNNERVKAVPRRLWMGS